MTTIEHVSKYIDSLSGAVKRLRFAALVIGAGLTALGHYARGTEGTWLAENANSVYWVGLTVLLLTNLVLVFVDKQSIETIKSLHKEESKNKDLLAELNALHDNHRAAVAWLTLDKLISELVDQAIEADHVDQEAAKRLYAAAVEFIAEYKNRLFGMEDDYINISIYEFNSETAELECVACFRSRPSDADGPHRTWKIGEGHVGKAFEVQNELVCGDATAPDVAAWIAAPPGKLRDDDIEKYVSLAAIPIAISTSHPLGVIIMTSSEPYRFVNFDEVDDDYEDGVDVQRAKFAVAALQDIAAQIAQLMSIIKSKQANQEVGSNENGS